MEDFMDNSDAKIRESALRIMFIALVIYFVINLLFSFYFIRTRTDIVFSRYLEFRIILPNCVNLFILAVTAMLNKNVDWSDTVKNRLVCIAMCLMCGTVSIVHSVFTGLWLLPCVTFIFCSIFNDRILRIILLVITVISEMLSCYQIVYEYPLHRADYILNLIIDLMVTALVFCASSAIQHYNVRLITSRDAMHRKELDYVSKITHDTLTGIYSRAYLMDMRKDLTRKLKENDKFVLGMVDIDDFKKVNDTFGHEKGDDVLRYLGGMLKLATNDNIRFARYGGEEFVCLFENMSLQECRNYMENLRQKLESKQFDFTDKPITFSCGLAAAHKTDHFDDLLKRADAAMYEAKNNGKNGITCKV